MVLCSTFRQKIIKVVFLRIRISDTLKKKYFGFFPT